MAGAEEVFDGLHRRDGVIYAALALNLRGVQRAVAAGVDELHMAYPLSDTFGQRNQGMTLAEAAAVHGDDGRGVPTRPDCATSVDARRVVRLPVRGPRRSRRRERPRGADGGSRSRRDHAGRLDRRRRAGPGPAPGTGCRRPGRRPAGRAASAQHPQQRLRQRRGRPRARRHALRRLDRRPRRLPVRAPARPATSRPRTCCTCSTARASTRASTSTLCSAVRAGSPTRSGTRCRACCRAPARSWRSAPLVVPAPTLAALGRGPRRHRRRRPRAARSTAPYGEDHSHDRVGLHGVADAVVRPADAEEVRRVVAWCYEHEVPIVPRGGGSGLAGGAVPVAGGVVVAMERLTRCGRSTRRSGAARSRRA